MLYTEFPIFLRPNMFNLSPRNILPFLVLSRSTTLLAFVNFYLWVNSLHICVILQIFQGIYFLSGSSCSVSLFVWNHVLSCTGYTKFLHHSNHIMLSIVPSFILVILFICLLVRLEGGLSFILSWKHYRTMLLCWCLVQNHALFDCLGI